MVFAVLQRYRAVVMKGGTRAGAGRTAVASGHSTAAPGEVLPGRRGVSGAERRGARVLVPRLIAEERRHIWNGASDTAARAARTIRSCAFTDPAAAADAAWAVADALHVAADILDSRTLRQAADSYARAARCGYGRIPRPTPAGNRLRATARLLTLAATAGEQDQAAVMMLVAKLAELAMAVTELRAIQRHAAQASAARAAAERLDTATCAGSSPGSADRRETGGAPASLGENRCQPRPDRLPGRI
jgi:hypothetical protein